MSEEQTVRAIDKTRIDALLQALRQIASGEVAEPILHARIALTNAGLEWKRPH